LTPDPEVLTGVELGEGGRTRGVQHRDEPRRAVAADRAGEHAAGLVRVVLPGVFDDFVVQRARDCQHARYPAFPSGMHRGLAGVWGGRPPGRAEWGVDPPGDDCISAEATWRWR